MKSAWLTILNLIVVCTGIAHAQISRLDPEQPRWGQTLSIIYDTGAPEAKFTANDEVYLSAKLDFPDHSETVSTRMMKAGKEFRFNLKIRENLSAITFHFITMSGGWDEQAYNTAIVFRADGQPARGAYASKIKSARYQEFFKQEMSLYPDNYSAYRAKWATAALVDQDKAGGMISAEIKKLARANETAELLYALSYGYLLIGREEKSREVIRQLAARFPSSPFAGLAIGDYEEQIANFQPLDGALAEIARLKLETVKANPSSEFARTTSTRLARDQRWPLDVSEKIAEAWFAAEPENPQPYFNLALACSNQYQKYERAVPAIERAIELLLAGKLRLYGDINGKQTEAMLPEAYLISADLAFRQKRFADAITTIKTAQVFALENDFAVHLLEAKIRLVVGENSAAESAFIEAWRRGSQEAEERLKEIYRSRSGGLNGFDEYLLSATKSKSDGRGWKQAAPSIKLTSMDGKRFDLGALTGKIVVINLWFIACGPCRKEIPKLNDMVREFSGKPIVFLAPSFDTAETLRDFLKKNVFDYQIIPDAETIITREFNASSFPTHIVVNQNGLIEATLVGASERRPEEVRRLILRLLNSQGSR